MSNVLQIDINPDIKLDEDRIVGMPDEIKGQLLATMTIACQRYDCHWSELTWKIPMYDGQPVIKVNKRETK